MHAIHNFLELYVLHVEKKLHKVRTSHLLWTQLAGANGRQMPSS